MAYAIRIKDSGKVYRQGTPEFNTLYSKLNGGQSMWQSFGASLNPNKRQQSSFGQGLSPQAPQDMGYNMPQQQPQGMGGYAMVQQQPQAQEVDPNYVNQMVNLYNALGPVNKQAAYGVLSDLIDYTSPVSQQQRQAEMEAARQEAMLRQYELNNQAVENQYLPQYLSLRNKSLANELTPQTPTPDDYASAAINDIATNQTSLDEAVQQLMANSPEAVPIVMNWYKRITGEDLSYGVQ